MAKASAVDATSRAGLGTAAAALRAELVADRRHLHRHPELGFAETGTARFVAERLRALGASVRTGIAGTGVVGLLQGQGPGKTVMLRADMDALPIHEQNRTAYTSTVPGVMHACGHDAHTAILLGAVRLLAERRHEWPGTVKLLFQPCEEGSAQGGGAHAMVEAGVLQDPAVDAAFGLHVQQYLPVGQIGVRAGAIHASYDGFTITIRGGGGHGARPHQTIDVLYVGAQVVVALQSLVSREIKPGAMGVVTVGSFHAGTAPNVIPAEAVLTGTIRAFDEAVRDHLVRRVEAVARGVCRTHRARCRVALGDHVPVVRNDAALAGLVREVAAEVVGGRHVVEPEPSSGSEDMAYFLERVPGCFFWVGCGNPAVGARYPHHHPRFDLDENALPIGAELLSAVAMRYAGISGSPPGPEQDGQACHPRGG